MAKASIPFTYNRIKKAVAMRLSVYTSNLKLVKKPKAYISRWPFWFNIQIHRDFRSHLLRSLE